MQPAAIWFMVHGRAFFTHSVSDRALTPFGGGDAVTTDTRIDPATTEARCRRLMAERAHLPDAYPHRDQRADLWALIHAELDAWLEAMT